MAKEANLSVWRPHQWYVSLWMLGCVELGVLVALGVLVPVLPFAVPVGLSLASVGLLLCLGMAVLPVMMMPAAYGANALHQSFAGIWQSYVDRPIAGDKMALTALPAPNVVVNVSPAKDVDKIDEAKAVKLLSSKLNHVMTQELTEADRALLPKILMKVREGAFKQLAICAFNLKPVHLKNIRALLDSGVCVDVRDHNGCTMLQWAIIVAEQDGKLDLIETLLQYSPDIDTKGSGGSSIAESVATHSGANKENRQAIRELIDAYKDRLAKEGRTLTPVTPVEVR